MTENIIWFYGFIGIMVLITAFLLFKLHKKD